MRYNFKKLRKTVDKYKKILGKIKGQTAFITLNIDQKKAFYSLAPLSQAIDELGADVNVQVTKGRSKTVSVLKKIWKIEDDLRKGLKNKETKALSEFLKIADKKCKGKLKRIFKKPEIMLYAGKNNFQGDFSLPYDMSWMKEDKAALLVKTAKVIYNQVYNLKKKERVGVGFELLRKKSVLGLPLEDYLDSFQISYAMMKAVKDQRVSMSSSTSRSSQLHEAERISELKATLLGCELSKSSKEPVFKKFKKLSSLVGIHKIEISSAVFGIRGKGYPGKHLFGDAIGYPSPNNKTRWPSPGMMLYKLDFYPQTALDPRLPKSRIGFTETIPLDIFIKTCNIDWLAMTKRDWKIRNTADRCEYIRVLGNKFGKFRTDLVVGLVSKEGVRRRFRGSDVETRNLVNPRFLKKGIKAGTMANLPGGEGFGTPEYMKGQFIGDVVISLDQSYRLSAKDPMIVNCYGNSYKIIKGPKQIIKKFNEKKQQGYKKLLQQEKHKSLPKEVIEIQKRNFNNIGEFAINTNPKAELCNYLIVNEKIANMIHIALGSGFDADRASVYHTDIVIDAPRQKLDIYGVDKNGKKHWIHKRGKFVI